MNNTTSAKIHRLFSGPGVAEPADILYALNLAGIRQVDISKACKTAPENVHMCIYGKAKSYTVATYIAAKLNTTLERLWGDAYDYTPLRRKAS
jgi:hypothetical protein